MYVAVASLRLPLLYHSTESLLYLRLKRTNPVSLSFFYNNTENLKYYFPKIKIYNIY